MEKFSVKAIRVNLKMTQEEMANHLNITTRAYADKENGINRWFFDEILKISELASIDVSKIKA